MIIKRMKEKSKVYEVGKDVAWAMREALINAEWEEIMAKDFERSPELDEIQALLSKVEEAHTRLDCAYGVLFNLVLDEEYNRRATRLEGNDAKFRWKLAVRTGLYNLEKETA